MAAPSQTVENYLKNIYQAQLSLPHDGLVSMGQLAAALGVVPGTATTMVKALAESGLAHYEPYAGVRLTAAGQKLAALVLRRHRLVELFLVRVMGMDWTEVHDEAENLEHAVSDRVIARMDDMLGHPSVDPHGDPIPDSNGKISVQHQLPLSDLPLNKQAIITSVQDQSSELLSFLTSQKITIGTRLEVKRKLPFDNSIEIKFRTKQSLNISEQIANAIQVNPL